MVGQVDAVGGQARAGEEQARLVGNRQPEVAHPVQHGAGDGLFRGVLPDPVVQHRLPKAFLLAGLDAAVLFRPAAAVDPLDAVGKGGADLGGGDLHGLADLRLARVAVQVGGHEEGRGRKRVALGQHGPLATRQDITRAVALAALADAVGIGKGGHFRQRHGGLGLQVRSQAGEAAGVVADARDPAAVRGPRAAGGEGLGVGDGLDPQGEVRGGSARQGIAFGQQRGQGGGGFSGPHQHVGQARMGRKRRQRAAMVGDLAGFQRAEVGQQGQALGIGAGIGRGQQGHRIGRGPPLRQVQGQGGQVGSLDFRRGEGGQRAFLALGPEAVAGAFGHAAGAAGALCRLGPGCAFGDQPRHARAGIETGAPGEPCVDHHADVFDGQRGLRDRGGQHDLAPLLCGPDRGALCGEGHRAK